ncbi:murein L,D-transpeptidase catalytic domain-containing protein [Ferruginibacter sp. SUN002]|uniref:murein L,D-transpeptidase catalytic domain-containing protein n=1 Tax=Ferruginibacter sp. SUN002 TaxID=2937789 RepID=UPI003D36D683
MKFFLKLTATFLLLIISISAVAYFFWYKPKFSKHADKGAFVIKKNEIDKPILARLKSKAENIAAYAKANHYNEQYCFMIDMKIESGKKRFFVYDLDNDTIELAGLVAHGSGKDNTDEIKFSNEPGSLCSSLGKYKIGKPYDGKFGLAYKLYGLDKTNSNAFNRFVVLHSHSCIPNEETAPVPICESWGCPTVAPNFLQTLSQYINKSTDPILLYIYQ